MTAFDSTFCTLYAVYWIKTVQIFECWLYICHNLGCSIVPYDNPSFIRPLTLWISWTLKTSAHTWVLWQMCHTIVTDENLCDKIQELCWILIHTKLCSVNPLESWKFTKIIPKRQIKGTCNGTMVEVISCFPSKWSNTHHQNSFKFEINWGQQLRDHFGIAGNSVLSLIPVHNSWQSANTTVSYRELKYMLGYGIGDPDVLIPSILLQEGAWRNLIVSGRPFLAKKGSVKNLVP